jgi:HAD superfamily hydrolase (TIGR01509 family)
LDVKHIIFDCDGVLVDSEPLSMHADVMLLNQFGIDLTVKEAAHRFIGKTFEAMLDEISAEYAVAFPSGLSASKDQMLEALFRRDLNVVDGVPALLDDLRARGLTFSVASNSPRARVALALELTGIAHHFDAITTFEEVARGKPAPDVFLRAVEKTSLPAPSCRVVEDSSTGVMAAVAAGLMTFGFTGTHHAPGPHAETLMGLGAHKVTSSMQSLLALLAE